jgi:PIN domain nuclease of toxin-antitoxin system
VKQVLLDTHALLWFVFDDARLSDTAAATIENERVTKLLSKASLWEITIKTQIGKLNLGMSLTDFFERFIINREIELIDIELGHLVVYQTLPLHHRDPFDRLLAAIARKLNIPIVSADSCFSKYDVKVIW